MADGIAVSRPGDIPFAILSELAERVVTVSEESLSRGLLLCLERAKQVVEPAGAAGVAALLEHSRDFVPPVVVVLSGGNIDPLLLSKLLRHGLTAAGRYLAFRCRLPDHPGRWPSCSATWPTSAPTCSRSGTSGWARGCTWTRPRWSWWSRPAARTHCEEVIGALRAAGYTLAFS